MLNQKKNMKNRYNSHYKTHKMTRQNVKIAQGKIYAISVKVLYHRILTHCRTFHSFFLNRFQVLLKNRSIQSKF